MTTMVKISILAEKVRKDYDRSSLTLVVFVV